MKRIALVLALVIAALAGLAMVIPWLTPDRLVRKAISHEIMSVIGQEPIIAGESRLSLIPVPTVTVDSVSIPGSEQGETLLTADSIEGTVRLLPLLLGRIEVSSVSINKAHLSMTADDAARLSGRLQRGVLSGTPSAQTPGARASDAEGPDAQEPGLPLDSIRFVDGIVSYTDPLKGRSLSLAIEDAAITWPVAGGPLSASGIVDWRGQTIDLSLILADPQALLGGSQSDIRAKAACDLLRVSFGGTVRMAKAAELNGTLATAAPSLRDVMRWLGLELDEGESLGAFKLQSPAVLKTGSVSLSAVQAELDGNNAEGALVLTSNGDRTKLSGTLAADTLDVTPYAEDLQLTEGLVRRWRDDPINLSGLALLDVDMRISSGETILGRARLEHAAASAVSHDGLLELSLGEAETYGGTLKGRVVLGTSGDQATIGANADFEGIDLAQALPAFFGYHNLEGTGRGSFDITAQGRSVRELMSSLTGKADFATRAGALNGLDLTDMMHRIERRPLSAGFEPLSGRTPFDSFSGSFTVANGVADTNDVKLMQTGLEVGLNGGIDIGGRGLGLSGAATLSKQGGGPPFTLPFKIAGQWERPTVEPDADALIRQSGAAAPLLKGLLPTFSNNAEANPTTVVP